MTCSPEELAQRERLEAVYACSQAPVMRAIERSVCGCDYGGNSWTTRAEADGIAARLGLRAGVRLLDLGAGSGWPGLYFAETTGCSVVLLDLPLSGIRIASGRAARDGLSGRALGAVADAAVLPLPDGSFDAVSHSDLLCCLRAKREVLAACRRVIRRDGQMAFTVISIAPGLSDAAHARAIAAGPAFVESDTDYATLLAGAGWAIAEREDLTSAYGDSCGRQLRADEANRDALVALLGTEAFDERVADWRAKRAAIDDGLLRRELFVVAPAG